MRRICGWHCRFLGRAKLVDYEAGLGKRGYLNIRPQKGQEVFGVLYEIDEDGISMLDQFEDYPHVFERKELFVFDDHKIKYKAHVYFEPIEQFGGLVPKEVFFRRVIAAAREVHLPEEWIKKIELIAKISK